MISVVQFHSLDSLHKEGELLVKSVCLFINRAAYASLKVL